MRELITTLDLGQHCCAKVTLLSTGPCSRRSVCKAVSGDPIDAVIDAGPARHVHLRFGGTPPEPSQSRAQFQACVGKAPPAWPNSVVLSPSAHKPRICVTEQPPLGTRFALDIGGPDVVLVRSLNLPDALASCSTARLGAAWKPQGVHVRSSTCLPHLH